MNLIKKAVLSFTSFVLCSIVFMGCTGLDGIIKNLPNSLSSKYDFLKQNKNVLMPEEFPGEGWYIVTMGNWSTDEEYENERSSDDHELFTFALYFDETGYNTIEVQAPCLNKGKMVVVSESFYTDLLDELNSCKNITMIISGLSSQMNSMKLIRIYLRLNLLSLKLHQQNTMH